MKYTDEELLSILKRITIEKGRHPKQKDFYGKHLPSPRTISDRLGGWDNALILIGIDTKKLQEEKDKEFTADYQSDATIEEIQAKYGYKDFSSVYDRARKLNLPHRRQYLWDEDKVSYLIENYEREDMDTLTSKLHPITKQQIYSQANQLGLKKEEHLWADEEIEILKTSYSIVPIEDLLKMLPKRSYPSITTKAGKLNLDIYVKKWSGEDIEKLKNLYPFYSNKDLLGFFPDRTLSSISSMAKKILGLDKDYTYMNKYKESTKKQLLSKLKDFATVLGRTPTTDDITGNKDMPGIASYHRYFGSYAKACKEVGLEVNVSLFGKSNHHISQNGDICLSKKELEITNLLIDNNVKYEKETLYRDIIEDENLSFIRTDWYINNEIVVEYFGMPEKEYYRKRMNEKIDLCKTYEIPLIDLYPSDIKNNYQGLIDKFKEYGIEIVI